MVHLYFSTTSRVQLLFLNAYVHKFAHTIICAMNKNAKIIFSRTFLSCYLINTLSGRYLPGYCSLTCPGLETVVKNRMFWQQFISNPAWSYSTRASYSGKAYWLSKHEINYERKAFGILTHCTNYCGCECVYRGKISWQIANLLDLVQKNINEPSSNAK